MKADKFTLLGGGGALLVIIAAFAYAMRNKKDQSQDQEVEDHMAKMRAAKAAKKANKVEPTNTREDANESTNSEETNND